MTCPLSPKQIEVVQWLSHGKTVDQIAAIVNRNKGTLRKQINKAFAQTGAANTTGLVAKSIRSGWIS